MIFKEFTEKLLYCSIEMAEYNCYRLNTPEERNWEILKNRNLIRRIGWKAFEYFKNNEFATLMDCYDRFTLHLENGGAGRVELEARRLLVVELHIQHADMMTIAFNFFHPNPNLPNQH